MTDLAFHFGAPDKMAYACRLARKAVASGAKVVLVVSDDQALAHLDAALWALAPTDFLPHCVGSAPQNLLRRSAVVVTTGTEQAPQHCGVLVNLTDRVPQGFERFDRLIEVVSTDEQDRAVARGRWRHYAEQGYAITRHDLSLKRAD